MCLPSPRRPHPTMVNFSIPVPVRTTVVTCLEGQLLLIEWLVPAMFEVKVKEPRLILKLKFVYGVADASVNMSQKANWVRLW